MADPWRWWSAERIAAVTGCPVANVREHWPILAEALAQRGIWERDIARGVLATVAIETASTFLPLHEYGTEADWAGYSGGPIYAGRGYVQLTHDYGYRAAGQALGLDLLGNPDLALVPQIAADVLAWYWASKTIPSKDGKRSWTLAQLCRERDWLWVRKAVQGATAGLGKLLQIVRDLGDGMTQLRVTDDGVRLRERPDLQAPILYEARAGELVEPLTDHAWRQVRAGDRTGWMAAEYLESVQGESTETAHSNIRSFDPNTPTELQRQDWTCSIRATMWLLKSLGVAVTPEEAQDAMSPRYVRPDVGLLDASGAGIVQVLHDVWGIGAYNDASATFDEVLAVAGRQPVAMGGRAWNHWTAVRGWDGPPGVERLLLANPGGTGPRYGQQTLSRQQFADLGPFSMVVVPLGS
ncbi:MAG: hypothetical protein IT306_29265 [Chloroflexi bacterium]|nr:hypothetical protein [Chloroflexota bacterium]